MPKRGWRYFLAIGLAALLGFGFSSAILLDAWRSQTYYEQQAGKAAQTARDSGSIHAERACALVSLAERAECQADEYNEARERERQEYDLQAQLVMSAWTRAMGLAALVATVTGIIGVGLVYATFDETRKGNQIAKRAAEAAERDAQAARDSLVLAERAIIRINLAFLEEVDAKARSWPATFRVRNEGRSNAHKFRVDWVVKSEPHWTWKFTEFRNLAVLCRPGPEPSDLDITIRAPKRFPAYLIGMISYHTVHDTIFRTYFCREITGIPFERDPYNHVRHSGLQPKQCRDMPRDT
jgi:hypothetical protein